MSELTGKLMALYEHLHSRVFPKFIDEHELENRTREFNVQGGKIEDIFLPTTNKEGHPTSLWGIFPEFGEDDLVSKEIGIYFRRSNQCIKLLEKYAQHFNPRDLEVPRCPPFAVYVWEQDPEFYPEEIIGYVGTFEKVLQQRDLLWRKYIDYGGFYEEWDFEGYSDQDNFPIGFRRINIPVRSIFRPNSDHPRLLERLEDRGLFSECKYRVGKKNSRRSKQLQSDYSSLIDRAFESYLEIKKESEVNPNEEQAL